MESSSTQPQSRFELLHLPIELQVYLIQSLVSISIQRSRDHQLRSTIHNFEAEEDLPIPINWSDLINLAATCRSLHELCSPFYQRRLTISTTPPKSLVTDTSSNQTLSLFQICNHYRESYPGLSNVSTLYYVGRNRVPNGPYTLSLENPFQLVNATRQLLTATSKLRALCLSHLDGVLVAGFLSHPLPTLESLALCYITSFPQLQPQELSCLTRLKALKIQECDRGWLQTVRETRQLEHLCVWMPALHIRDLDWFSPSVLFPTLRYLNLDGFKGCPRLLVQLCDQIQVSQFSIWYIEQTIQVSGTRALKSCLVFVFNFRNTDQVVHLL